MKLPIYLGYEEVGYEEANSLLLPSIGWRKLRQNNSGYSKGTNNRQREVDSRIVR